MQSTEKGRPKTTQSGGRNLSRRKFLESAGQSAAALVLTPRLGGHDLQSSSSGEQNTSLAKILSQSFWFHSNDYSSQWVDPHLSLDQRAQLELCGLGEFASLYDYALRFAKFKERLPFAQVLFDACTAALTQKFSLVAPTIDYVTSRWNTSVVSIEEQALTQLTGTQIDAPTDRLYNATYDFLEEIRPLHPYETAVTPQRISIVPEFGSSDAKVMELSIWPGDRAHNYSIVNHERHHRLDAELYSSLPPFISSDIANRYASALLTGTWNTLLEWTNVPTGQHALQYLGSSPMLLVINPSDEYLQKIDAAADQYIPDMRKYDLRKEPYSKKLTLMAWTMAREFFMHPDMEVDATLEWIFSAMFFEIYHRFVDPLFSKPRPKNIQQQSHQNIQLVRNQLLTMLQPADFFRVPRKGAKPRASSLPL